MAATTSVELQRPGAPAPRRRWHGWLLLALGLALTAATALSTR